MDGSAAIERNRVALQRIVATLIAMAGLGPDPEVRAEGGLRRTLPRHLWRAILRLLRPAEAAARRLIIAAARGLVVPPPRPRKPRPKPKPMPTPETREPFLRNFGLAVMVSPAGLSAVARGAKAEGDGGGGLQPRVPAFPLFDPLRNPLSRLKRRRYVPAHAAPRIMFPGVTEPSRLPPPPPPPSPDDPISATRLGERLAALAAALDDLPRQARRFARWKAAREAAPTTPGKFRRISPLRGGPPPGCRLKRYDPTARRPSNVREIDEILAHAHALAIYALESPDTS